MRRNRQFPKNRSMKPKHQGEVSIFHILATSPYRLVRQGIQQGLVILPYLILPILLLQQVRARGAHALPVYYISGVAEDRLRSPRDCTRDCPEINRRGQSSRVCSTEHWRWKRNSKRVEGRKAKIIERRNGYSGFRQPAAA